MAGIAKITLVGNLGRDPETRYTPNGKMNVTFTMAVSRRFNDQSGQQQERTNWYRVTAWGGLAESLDRLAQNGYLAKGKQVYVDGRLEAREYQDQQGQTRTSLDVTANELQPWLPAPMAREALAEAALARARRGGGWTVTGSSGPGGATRIDRRGPLGRWRATVLGRK